MLPISFQISYVVDKKDSFFIPVDYGWVICSLPSSLPSAIYSLTSASV